MTQSVSPYTLLCASKPDCTPTVGITYDLYSQAHQANAVSVSPAACVPESKPNQPAQRPCRKTHYIADIQARHGSASVRSRQMPWNP